MAEAGDLTPEAAVANTQAALVFIGNTSQHFAADRRKALLQQLNPKLKSLVEDSDFSEAPPFLFGTDFGKVAKERLDATEVLKKVSTSSGWAGKVFSKGPPLKKYSKHMGLGRWPSIRPPKLPAREVLPHQFQPQPRRQGRAAVHQVTPLVHPVATVSTIPVLCTQESKSVINCDWICQNRPPCTRY